MLLEVSYILVLTFVYSTVGDIPFFLTSNRHNIHSSPSNKANPVTPCKNFYEYACSTWKTETTKPDFELSWNHFTAASYQIKKKVQNILESPLEDSYPPLNSAQRFYNACIHFEKRKHHYLEDLRMLIDYFKGWPIINENWSITGYDWLTEVVLITRKLGFHPIIKFHVGIDYKNTDKYVLYIEPGSLVFPQNILLNPLQFATELEAYEEWISKSIQYIFPEKIITKRFNGEVAKIIDFERKLAKFMTVKSKMERNTMDHFSKKLPVNFSRILDHLFSDVNKGIKPPEIIVFRNYGYIENLLVFMKRISNRKVANYLIWTIVREFSRDISVELKKINFSVDKTVLGINSDISRETECTNKATDYFSFAILPKYLDLYLKNDVITKVQDIAKKIKSEYINLLMENKWLSNETKILAIEKVTKIQYIVGYSGWMNKHTVLIEYYDKLVVTTDHFKNIIEAKQLKIKRNLLLLRTTVRTPLWPSNVFDVNAYYSILQNLVFVPLGILQEPFYHENGPRFYNYGALGSLIGHEFSHSLDTTGRQANSNGRIEKWWPNEDISGYQLRSKCFEIGNQQPDMLLMGENIADNVGLDISYKAYKKLKNMELDDIFWNLQNEKIFFISYAQMWCEISDHLDLFSDEHTSVETRVNQAVQNNHHFNQIFKCTKNQSEHSICKLW